VRVVELAGQVRIRKSGALVTLVVADDFEDMPEVGVEMTPEQAEEVALALYKRAAEARLEARR